MRLNINVGKENIFWGSKMNCYVHLIGIIVLVKCISAHDTEKVEAVVGFSAELPCKVTPENKEDRLNILAWYKNGSSAAFYSRDLRGRKDNMGVTTRGSRYRLVEVPDKGLQKLMIISVSPSDAGQYHCVAEFAASPTLQTHIHLVVIEPPQLLWLSHENGTRIVAASLGSNRSVNLGPYYVGDSLRLLCVAFEGISKSKPLSTITWWYDGRMVKNSSTPVSGQRVRSDYVSAPLRREDHGLILTCIANNNNKTPSLAIDTVIEMYLPLELIVVRRADSGVNGLVNAGDTLVLQCRVLGARPPPPVIWQLNDSQMYLPQNITVMDPSQRLLVSEIQIAIEPDHDEMRVSCCAPAYRRGDEQYLCSEALPLTVLYKPIVQIVVEGEVENNTITVLKGSNVILNCTYRANPPVNHILWFHEEEVLSQENEEKSAVIEPLLELINVTEADSGEYACAAYNEDQPTYSNPIVVDVIYPSTCEDVTIMEYGIGENESLELVCNANANPVADNYEWIIVKDATNATVFEAEKMDHTIVQTENNSLVFQRANDTPFNTIFCRGVNGVEKIAHTPCTFLVTDETVPHPPTDCIAVKNILNEISISCHKGHDGGLPQKFQFSVKSVDSDDELVSITNLEPNFMIQEPQQENYKFVIIATNEKGDSNNVEIDKESIIVQTIEPNESISSVMNITTLSLALCGGVALIALAACGLVLCAHERGSRLDLPRAGSEPPLCAYNTEESNCETYHDSDDGSDCNVRRTDSFKRAMARYPSKNYDVRRTSSFHSARYMHDTPEHDSPKCNEIRHSASCRVHSLQNISRKREMDSLCDHLIMHLPQETNYNIPKPMNTFYTIPRKMRHKVTKEPSDEASEITQTSDGFSLPPPPDEFGTYKAATRIKDIPSKSFPSYTTIRKNPGQEPKQQYSNVIISPMNTVGLPTISGATSLYTYPDDEGHQGIPRSTGFLTTFHSYAKESGI